MYSRRDVLRAPVGLGLGLGLGIGSGGGPSGPAAFVSGFGAIGEFAIGQSPIGTAGSPVAALRQAGNNWFNDNVTFSAQGTNPNDFVRHDGFSRVSFITSDTSIIVEAVPSHPSDQDSNSIALYVNGVFNQTIAFDGTVNVRQQKTITLPAGASKTIELWEGPSAFGASLTALSFLGSVTPKITPTRRLSIYGDSISQGYYGIPRSNGWAPQMRFGTRFDGVRCGGASGQSLKAVGTTGGQQDTLVAEIVSTLDGSVENVVVIALGTNDYHSSLWSAASFGTAYASTLDKLIAACSAQIFCLGQFVSTETGNNTFGAGNDQAAYDSQISTAAGARSSRCTYINGQPMMLVGDLFDSLHPANAGHAKAKTAIAAIV
jgi:hypothetical protein